MLAIQGYGSDNSDNEPEEESSPAVPSEAPGSTTGGFSMSLKICSAPDVVPTVCNFFFKLILFIFFQ